MRVALYVRVSTERQALAATIDQQLDRLRDYVQTRGWSLPADHVFRDEGFSGATLRRPGLQRLREWVAEGRLDQIILTAPDRLARKYAHQVLLLDELTQAGCAVEFLDRPMSQDPHDQLVLQVRGAVAEYERSLITERMQRGRHQKLKAGILLPWSRAPFGYQLDPDRPRDPGGVRCDAVTAAIVAEMFAYYLGAGHSLDGLAKHLIAAHIPTPNGQWRWNQATVRGILSNPAYTGTLYANRWACTKAAHKRQSALAPIGPATQGHTLRPAEEWWVIGQIPPVVRQEVFAAVQAKLGQNQQWARRNNHAHDYLLRALVSCGLCRLACTGRTQARGGYGYYVCNGKAHPIKSCQDRKCPARFIPVQQLDAVVWSDLCALLRDPATIAAALARAQQGAWAPQELQARQTTLRKAVTALKQQLERLTDAYLAGVIPLAEYERRRRDVEQRRGIVEQQTQQLAGQADRQQELAGVIRGVEAFCARVGQGLADADFALKRQLVELLIDRVVVTGEEVEIRYVIPTSPHGEQVRFCQLRLDYLHPPAALQPSRRPAILRLAPIAPVVRDHGDPLRGQCCIQPVTVIGFVASQMRGQCLHQARGQRLLHQGNFAGVCP